MLVNIGISLNKTNTHDDTRSEAYINWKKKWINWKPPDLWSRPEV